ncbi:MAG: SDR family NAD(P)-dependent oxidoreductase [Burkholderiales bacterium]
MSTNVFEGATVLITGASSGIGEAFAHNLAKRGANLILTARSKDKLDGIADELRGKYRISVHVFPEDLILPHAPQQLFERIKTSGLSVDVLINNAGFGKWAHFLGESLGTYDQMLSLNINALVRLTYLFIPDMLAHGKGGVINVASTAAFQPVPYIAIYSASKAFVLSFTEALAGEYRERGIRTLALCPGNTATNFMVTANANTTGMSFATPEKVAEAGLIAFLKGKSHHVPGCVNYLTSLLPRALSRAVVIKIVVGMFKNRVAPWPA